MAGEKPIKPKSVQQDDATASLETVCVVDNVHCASCVTLIEKVLSKVGAVRDIDVSIIKHEVRLWHGRELAASDIAKVLIEAAFEVHHVTTYEGKQDGSCNLEIDSWVNEDIPWRDQSSLGRRRTKKNDLHIENCEQCRKEITQAGSSSASTSLQKKGSTDSIQFVQSGPSIDTAGSPSENLPPKGTELDGQFAAIILIDGMSCAACANTITDGIKRAGLVENISINLLTNSAAVEWTGSRSVVQEVVGQIENMGFEAVLDHVDQLNPQASQPQRPRWVVHLAITGMTCGACVGTITKGLKKLRGTTEVSVNLLTHGCRVEFDGADFGEIVTAVEDMGFEAAITSVTPLVIDPETESLSRESTRTVSILVNGMFCDHCPPKVLEMLREKFPDISIKGPLSLDQPVLTITYTPHPPTFTIRSILAAITSTHEAFEATLYRPPSIEERSSALQAKHQRQLWRRTCFVFIAAVPTFLVGVVFMNFVPPENHVRRYLERSWLFDISRMDWALFVLATPVMFYGADIFHRRGIKEIYTLWRPSSPVPLLQRFYRFGSMNLLISCGTMVAYLSSGISLVVNAVHGGDPDQHRSTCFDSVVFLTFFILLGRCLEAYSKAKTDEAVASLGKLRPTKALLLHTGPDGDRTESVEVDMLEIGDLVSVPHGASPPADGVMKMAVTGSEFDESSLTGESKPVRKQIGDSIYAGSVNIGPPVQAQILRGGGRSMLDQIIAVVREGQSKRAPSERAADAMTAFFVPIITLIAIVTFLVWATLGLSGVLPDDYLDVSHMNWTFWSLEFAIAVFVASCPCGLALAAPTALFVGGGVAARYGILVKGGGEAFQEASRLDAVVFDKTGTLTDCGSLQVTDYAVLAESVEQSNVAWALARQLEESSNHPVGNAIRQFCQEEQPSSLEIRSSSIEEIHGHGMRGQFSVSLPSDTDSCQSVEYEAAIGNERLLKQLAPSAADTYYVSNTLSRFQASGKSVVILSMRKCDTGESLSSSSFTPVLVFSMSEAIRPEATKVISSLRKSGVSVYMCTGDGQHAAHSVAETLGISLNNVVSNALPTDKAAFIQKIQKIGDGTLGRKKRPTVAYVGDGVNDAPALTAADVSIAMASGSDVAMNSAGFILLNSDLNLILRLVLLSRRVFRRIIWNFCWATIYNACLVPIAAGVFYPIVIGKREQVIDGRTILVDRHWRLKPVWAALAMALSSISVLLSSLALGIEKRHLKQVWLWPFREKKRESA